MTLQDEVQISTPTLAGHSGLCSSTWRVGSPQPAAHLVCIHASVSSDQKEVREQDKSETACLWVSALPSFNLSLISGLQKRPKEALLNAVVFHTDFVESIVLAGGTWCTDPSSQLLGGRIRRIRSSRLVRGIPEDRFVSWSVLSTYRA